MARKPVTPGSTPAPGGAPAPTFLQQAQKKYGAAVAETLYRGRIVTPSLALNWATGIGGLPRGGFSLWWGPFHGGKTTLAAFVMAGVVEMGGVGFYLDVERAAVLSWFHQVGLPSDSFIYKMPKDQEDGIDAITAFLNDVIKAKASGQLSKTAPVLVVIDSVTMFAPRDKIEGKIGAKDYGLAANILNDWIKTATILAERAGAHVILISQERGEKGGLWNGGRDLFPKAPDYYKWRPTTGDALLFGAPVCLRIEKGANVKVGEDKVGRSHRVRTMRTKFGSDTFNGRSPFEYFTSTLGGTELGCGIDRAREVVNFAVEAGILLKSAGLARVEASWDASLSWSTENKLMGAMDDSKDLLDEIFGHCQGWIDAEAKKRGVLPASEGV
jgi:recombination protein RecA